MKFIGVAREQLDAALAEVNRKYNGNIVFEWRDLVDHTRRDGREEWRVKLKTLDSRAYGSRRSIVLAPHDRNSRYIPAACWHVHGEFFDALGRLAPEAEMIGSAGAFGAQGRRCRVAAHGWVDHLTANAYDGVYASDACDCAKFEGEEE